MKSTVDKRRAPARPQPQRVTICMDPAMVERVDGLADQLAERLPGVTRSAVTRAILGRGLDALDGDATRLMKL